MNLKPFIALIPEETVCVARAAFQRAMFGACSRAKISLLMIRDLRQMFGTKLNGIVFSPITTTAPRTGVITKSSQDILLRPSLLYLPTFPSRLR